MFARRLLGAGLLAVAAQAAPAAFRPQPGEQVFLDLLRQEHHPLEAREAARTYLGAHPDSFLAFEVIGYIYLRTDGDLPRALYYLARARSLMEARYPAMAEGSPYNFYAPTLSFLAETQQAMERYEDALRTLEVRDHFYKAPQPAEQSWPLLKLGRYREARAKIDEATRSGDPAQVTWGLNTLGAIEGENDQPEASFSTHLGLVDLDRAKGKDRDATYIRNAGNAAMNLGLLPRAESYFLEATGFFVPWTLSNPWADLAGVYLLEMRLPEAMDAVKEMHRWAFHSRPMQADTRWNERQVITGSLLLYCGCTDEALTIARRLVERPDRHAGGSAREGQRVAGTQLFHLQTVVDAQARAEEEASCAPWARRPALLARRARLALEAALARRRVGALLMDNGERLGHALRYLGPQSILDAPGGEVLLAGIAGPGVAEAEALRLLARTGAAADRERGFLLFALGAARLERGRYKEALEALAVAQPLLQAERAVLHNELLGMRARALAALGDTAGTVPVLEALLQRDGGEVRRQGLRLPCRILASGPAASRAAALLAGSPRLEPGRGGFTVVVEPGAGGGLQGGLDGPRGTVLCRFQVPAGKDADATARDFCRDFHRKAFGPRVDLSQQQIRSLEGSTLASRDVADQLKGLLD